MKKKITKAAAYLKLNAGQDANTEASILSKKDLAVDADTDAVFLIDAENAFNSINGKVMLHFFEFVFPIIATDIVNCGASPSGLFIIYCW